MRTIILIGLLLLILLEYSLCVITHDADERAERMYRRWKSERSDSTPDE